MRFQFPLCHLPEHFLASVYVLDLIHMECAAVCPVGDAQVCTHAGIALSALLISLLVLLPVSQPGPKVTLDSG